jgi:hypothetical protein
MVASTIEAMVALTVPSKFEALVVVNNVSTSALKVTSIVVAIVGVKVVFISA